MPTSSSVRDAHERDGRILTEVTLTIRAYRPNEWKIRVVDLDTCEFVEARATTFADAAEQVLDDINRGGLE